MPTKKINQTTDKNKVNTAETTGTAPVVESMPFPPIIAGQCDSYDDGYFPSCRRQTGYAVSLS